MDKYSEIKKRIKNIAGKSEQNIFTAKVERVDGETCSVSVDGLTLNDVRLRAVINGENSKLIITPVKGSYVLVTDLSKGNYSDLAVLNVSEIDSITIDVENDIIINGGTNEGLIKIEKLTEKLNDLVDWCKNHTHNNSTFSGTISGAPATGTLTVPCPPNPPSDFNKSYYENDKIKH